MSGIFLVKISEILFEKKNCRVLLNSRLKLKSTVEVSARIVRSGVKRWKESLRQLC